MEEKIVPLFEDMNSHPEVEKDSEGLNKFQKELLEKLQEKKPEQKFGQGTYQG